jgi:hypothetical protein
MSHVSFVETEATRAPFSPSNETVALESLQRQPVGSLGYLHHRFLMSIELIEYNPSKSTSHHEPPRSVVWEKVLGSPSMALSALKLCPDLDTNVEDWTAFFPRAILTPSMSRTCTSNIWIVA